MTHRKDKVIVLNPKEGYDMIAKIYSKYHEFLDERDNGLFKRFLPRDLKGLHILDLGGGDARMSKYFASRNVGEYVLADISPKMLKKGKGWMKKVLMDIDQKFPFEEGYFDIVLCFFVILHLGDLENFFAESYRILKPGGKMIVLHHMERRPFEYKIDGNEFKIKTYNYRYLDVEKFAKNNFFDINYIDLKNGDNIIGKLYLFTKN